MKLNYTNNKQQIQQVSTSKGPAIYRKPVAKHDDVYDETNLSQRKF